MHLLDYATGVHWICAGVPVLVLIMDTFVQAFAKNPNGFDELKRHNPKMY